MADAGQILSAFGIRLKLSSLKLRSYYSGSEKVSSFSVPATLGCFFIRGDATSINIGYITAAGAIGNSVTYSVAMTADADILLGGSSYSSAITGLNTYYAAALYASNLSDADLILLGLQLMGYCKTSLGVNVS